MKKRIVFLSVILLGIIIIVVFLPNIYNDPIRKSLTSFGFESSDDKLYYNKQLSSTSFEDYSKYGDTYDNLSFNFDNYTLNRNYMFYSDDIDVTYNFIYNYSNNNISFIARYVYKESNIILNGEYNVGKDKFICNTEVEYFIELDTSKELLCSDIENVIKETKIISDNIFDADTIKTIQKESEN